MPTSEVVQEGASEPRNYKTWILKVSIHCEGCKKKVKKILTNIQGVYSVDIETKQQKAIVTGTVDADTLINKLIKSGKHAGLWPENPNQKEKKSAEPNNKDTQIRQNHDPQPNNEAGQANSIFNADKEIKPPVGVKTTGGAASPAETGGDPKAGEAPAKVPGAHEVKDSNSEGKVPESGSVREIPLKVSAGQGVKESKSEGKLPESSSAGNQSPAAPVEKKNEGGENDNVAEKRDADRGGGGGNGTGRGGKKNKNKGQTGNKTDGEPQSVAPPAGTGSLHHNGRPPVSVLTNQSFPRHHGPPYYYTPAPSAFGVSYNMAHPSSNCTTSYYSPPLPNSYAYSYSGSGLSMEGPYPFSYPGSSMEPQSTDFDSYPRQPLDSFEMFSDENPNGCSIS